MANYVKCKACGLVIDESKLKNECPACGVPKTAFEPYVERVSPKRKLYLDLHIHPILVHIPQALAVLIPIFILGRLLFPTFSFTEGFITAATLLTILLPLSAVPAAAAGIADGKVRFKKLKTPYLITKMILAGALLLMATIMAIMAVNGWLDGPVLLIFFILDLGCLLCQVFMAKIGVQMMFTVIPG